MHAQLLDVGCATGLCTVYMCELGYSSEGIDLDPGLVAAARKLAGDLGRVVAFREGDAFRLSDIYPVNTFRACYSGGFLEHFSDKDIQHLVAEQFKVAEYVFLWVPTPKYGRQSFGDERLMAPERWMEMLEGYKLFASETMHNGFWFTGLRR